MIAELMLDIGFYELFFKRDMFADLLVLNILCLRCGGGKAFMRWMGTSDGLSKFIEEFLDLKCSIRFSTREMFVYQNQVRAFAFSFAYDLPQFVVRLP